MSLPIAKCKILLTLIYKQAYDRRWFLWHLWSSRWDKKMWVQFASESSQQLSTSRQSSSYFTFYITKKREFFYPTENETLSYIFQNEIRIYTFCYSIFYRAKISRYVYRTYIERFSEKYVILQKSFTPILFLSIVKTITYCFLWPKKYF